MTIQNNGENVEKLQPSYIVHTNVRYILFGKLIWQFLKKLNIHLSYDQVIPLLWNIHTKTCIWMVSHRSPKLEKVLKIHQLGKWVSKMCYSNTMEYCSAIKRNKLLIHTTRWMNLKNIRLSEKSQTHKTIYRMISFINNFWKMQNHRKWTQTGGCLSLGVGGGILMNTRELWRVVKI